MACVFVSFVRSAGPPKPRFVQGFVVDLLLFCSLWSRSRLAFVNSDAAASTFVFVVRSRFFVSFLSRETDQRSPVNNQSAFGNSGSFDMRNNNSNNFANTGSNIPSASGGGGGFSNTGTLDGRAFGGSIANITIPTMSVRFLVARLWRLWCLLLLLRCAHATDCGLRRRFSLHNWLAERR